MRIFSTSLNIWRARARWSWPNNRRCWSRPWRITRLKMDQSESLALQRRLEAANLSAQNLSDLLNQARDELSAQAELNEGLQQQLDGLMKEAPDREQMRQRMEELDELLTRREEELAGQLALKNEQRQRMEELDGLLTSKEEELAGLQALYHEKQQQYDEAVEAMRQTLESLTNEEKAHRETQDKLLIMEQQDEMNRGTISELRAQLNLMSEEMMDLEFQLQESERLRSQLEEDLAGYQAGTAQAASATPLATPLATPSATPSPAPTAAPMVTEEASEKADSTVQP